MSEPFVLVTAAQRRSLVRVSDVQEILALMALSVTGAERGACRGMANLRGEVIPVFDLGGPDAPLHPSRFVLVSRSASDPIGLVVDEIHDVVSLPEGSVVTRASGDGRSLTVARVGDDLLAVLEPSDVLATGR